MKKPFYLTTTLPYVNADPHIGFALEIVQADTIARYQRLLGNEVFFNTGTDEHGQKIYQKSLEQDKDPQAYCDEYAQKFDNLKKALNLSYDAFIRTTNPHHIKAAQEFWLKCQENGDIYKAKYKIKYCVGCELEKQDSELENGKCPLHPTLELETREEENYFFRFSKYQQSLLKLYQDNPHFILPSWRQKEIVKFVEAGLQDFSISRLKTKMPWGIAVPNDPNHVMYVWFDALINYISTLGWPQDQETFEKFWPGMQLAGKDNLRQQSAMWQAMLLSAGLPNSTQILIHGFITSGGQKMSKSLGNVIDPYEVVAKYGTDATRYYLLKEIHPFKDGDFSYERFEEIYNADLANGLGNLVQRVATMAAKNNLFVSEEKEAGFDKTMAKHLDKFEFHLSIEAVWKKIQETDQAINKTQPWSLSGNKAQEVLTHLSQEVKAIAYNLQPFLPQTSETILEVFSNKVTPPTKPLFPRI